MNFVKSNIIFIFASIIVNLDAKSEPYLKNSPGEVASFLSEKSSIGNNDNPSSNGLSYFIMNVNIYTLENSITSEIKYIGKTEKPLPRRLSLHIALSKKTKVSARHLINWIKSLLIENTSPKIELLDIVPENEWQFWEKHYISLFRSWGFDLTNETIGGDGGDTFSNNPNKEEIREKMRVRRNSHLDNYDNYEKWRIANNERLSNPLYHKKISDCQIESYRKNPNRQKNLREKQKKRWGDPKERKKQSDSQTNRMKNEELRIRTSNSLKNFNQENPNAKWEIGKKISGENNYQWTGYINVYNEKKELKYQFISIIETSKALGIERKTIRDKIKNHEPMLRRKYKGWYFEKSIIKNQKMD